MILNYQKCVIDTKMSKIGAVVGEIWRIGSEKWGPRREQSDVCPRTCSLQAQVLPVGAKLRNCKLRGTYSIHISKVPPLGASVDPL